VGDLILSVNGISARGLIGQRAALREIASQSRWLLEIDGIHGARSVEISAPGAAPVSAAGLVRERFALRSNE
jgi:hypothetical protein